MFRNMDKSINKYLSFKKNLNNSSETNSWLSITEHNITMSPHQAELIHILYFSVIIQSIIDLALTILLNSSVKSMTSKWSILSSCSHTQPSLSVPK